VIYFLDASALVKRYVHEPGTDRVRALVRRKADLAASRISIVEIRAALARGSRDGRVRADVAESLVQRIVPDLAEMRVVEVRSRVVDLAADLAWRRLLTAYDAVQLASAIHLARSTALALSFLCSDARLSEAAAAEGLRSVRLG
jgi:predicted nucleic acid-binding protein